MANPFSVEEYGRTECIRMYMEWLSSKIDERDPDVIGELRRILEVSENGTAYLMCHCKPKACHGDVIMCMAEDRKEEIMEDPDA